MPREAQLTEYELERAAKIAENARLLASLGLTLGEKVKPKKVPTREKRDRSSSIWTTSSTSSTPRKRRVFDRRASLHSPFGRSNSEDELASPLRAPIKQQDYKICSVCLEDFRYTRETSPDLLEVASPAMDAPSLCSKCRPAVSGTLGRRDRSISYTSTEADYQDISRSSDDSASSLYSRKLFRSHRTTSMVQESSVMEVPPKETSYKRSQKYGQESVEEDEETASDSDAESEELEVGSVTSCKIINDDLHFHTTWKGRGPRYDTFQTYEDLVETVALESYFSMNPRLSFRGKDFSVLEVLGWRGAGQMMANLRQATKGRANVKILTIRPYKNHG